MKKVYSFVAAMMVALFAMVSCGTVQSIKEGVEAGKVFADSYTAANGDLQQILAAYDVAANKGKAYASDQVQTAMFMSGVFNGAGDKSTESAGAFLAIYNKVSTAMGYDVTTTVNSFIDGSKNPDAIRAAYDNFTNTLAQSSQAPADGDYVEDEEAEEAVEE